MIPERLDMTLDEFLDQPLPKWGMVNSYVNHPDFKSLYVRRGTRRLVPPDSVDRSIIKKERNDVVDIAYIEAERKGKGAFTRLIQKLHKDWTIYVESTINKRLQDFLIRVGFYEESPTCFVLLKESPLNLEKKTLKKKRK